MPFVAETFSRTVTLTETEIVEFARRIGDENPLHNDPEYAAKTRFSRIIACGPHYSSLFMALAATHFSRVAPMLGLEFSFHFRRVVLAGDTLTMNWVVTHVVPKGKLGGDLVSIKGDITNQLGKVVLISTGKVLVASSL
jgi:3-hydroxybutyryl-CoA dehydratase